MKKSSWEEVGYPSASSYLSHFYRGENEEIGSGFPWEKRKVGVMLSPQGA
jgi:hypothetical protein